MIQLRIRFQVSALQKGSTPKAVTWHYWTVTCTEAQFLTFLGVVGKNFETAYRYDRPR